MAPGLPTRRRQPTGKRQHRGHDARSAWKVYPAVALGVLGLTIGWMGRGAVPMSGVRRRESSPSYLSAAGAAGPSAATLPDEHVGRAGRLVPPPSSVAPPAPTIRRMVVTAYCPCERCCGRWAAVPLARRKTASGAALAGLLFDWRPFVAGPPSMPFGTLVSVPGYADGRPVPVLDRGGAIGEAAWTSSCLRTTRRCCGASARSR